MVQYPPIEDMLTAYVIIVVMAGTAGALWGLLYGFHFPKIGRFPGYHLTPKIKGIFIPPLVMMLIFGCIARNFFGPKSADYPGSYWSKYITGFSLAILLIRGGLNVKLAGKGLIIALLSTVPQLVEATTAAFITYGLYGYPISICFCLGYTLACISPSIIVPGLINL
jgi:NhaP-type Na+/H+ or K+/H+ antiporter